MLIKQHVYNTLKEVKNESFSKRMQKETGGSLGIAVLLDRYFGCVVRNSVACIRVTNGFCQFHIFVSADYATVSLQKTVDRI